MNVVGTSYTTGVPCRYTWSTSSADVDNHAHHFEASDNRRATARLPAADNHSGPAVSPTYKVYDHVKSEVPHSGCPSDAGRAADHHDENGYYETKTDTTT